MNVKKIVYECNNCDTPPDCSEAFDEYTGTLTIYVRPCTEALAAARAAGYEQAREQAAIKADKAIGASRKEIAAEIRAMQLEAGPHEQA